MKRPLLLSLTLVAICLLASGCGSGSSTSSSGSSISKAAYIKKADALCEKGNQEQSAALRAYQETEATRKTTEAELIKKIMLPHIKMTVERFAEVEPPSGEEEQIEKLVEADLQAVEQGMENPAVLVDRETSPFKEGTKLSMAYGFKICGQY